MGKRFLLLDTSPASASVEDEDVEPIVNGSATAVSSTSSSADAAIQGNYYFFFATTVNKALK
jgi:hypothetical protein